MQQAGSCFHLTPEWDSHFRTCFSHLCVEVREMYNITSHIGTVYSARQRPLHRYAAVYWLYAVVVCKASKRLLSSLSSHDLQPEMEECACLLWPGRKAVVVLKEVHSPFGKNLCILHLMSKACRKLCTCHAARIAVDTKLEPCGIITAAAQPLMCLPRFVTLLSTLRNTQHLKKHHLLIYKAAMCFGPRVHINTSTFTTTACEKQATLDYSWCTLLIQMISLFKYMGLPLS